MAGPAVRADRRRREVERGRVGIEIWTCSASATLQTRWRAIYAMVADGTILYSDSASNAHLHESADRSTTRTLQVHGESPSDLMAEQQLAARGQVAIAIADADAVAMDGRIFHRNARAGAVATGAAAALAIALAEASTRDTATAHINIPIATPIRVLVRAALIHARSRRHLLRRRIDTAAAV